MTPEETTQRWTRLRELLAPCAQRAQITARRLARTRTDGDDLFQEAVLRAFRKLPGLSDESRFGGWFYAVLLSVHRSRARRSFWRRFLSLEQARATGFDPPDAAESDIEENRRQAERATRALALLPAVQREAVVLFEIEGYSIEEIAAWQQVSIPAVKSRLQRGRDRLRRFYQRHLADDGPTSGHAPVANRTGAGSSMAVAPSADPTRRRPSPTKADRLLEERGGA